MTVRADKRTKRVRRAGWEDLPASSTAAPPHALMVSSDDNTCGKNCDAQHTAEMYGQDLIRFNQTYRDLVDVMEFAPFRRLFDRFVALGNRLDEQTLVMFMKTYEAARMTLPYATPNQLVAVVDGLIRRRDTNCSISAGAVNGSGDLATESQTPNDISKIIKAQVLAVQPGPLKAKNVAYRKR